MSWVDQYSDYIRFDPGTGVLTFLTPRTTSSPSHKSDDDNPHPHPKSILTKPRKVKNTPLARSRNFFKMWGGGSREKLTERIVSTLGLNKKLSKQYVGHLGLWLERTWFKENEREPTLDEIVQYVLIDNEQFEDWRKVLWFEEHNNESRKKAKPKVVTVDVPIQNGPYKLLFSIRGGQRTPVSRMGSGVSNWNADQPIAFLTNLGGKESDVSTILRNQAVQYLGLNPAVLRIVIPPMFATQTMRQLGNPLILETALHSDAILDFVSFSATAESKYFTDIDFLPLQYQTEEGLYKDLTREDDINSVFRGRVFDFVREYTTHAGNPKTLRGQIAIVKLRPKNVPNFRVAIALYYQAGRKMPELVGIFIFQSELRGGPSEEESRIEPVIRRFQNEEHQIADDPLVLEASFEL